MWYNVVEKLTGKSVTISPNPKSKRKMKSKDIDPMPSPEATPEEIDEFWDTHSLTDY